MSEPTLTKEDIAELTGDLVRRADEELFALSEDELHGRWWFRWNDHLSPESNLYEFSQALEAHSRECRRWETHHNGHVCVVERVRDKYLWPHIKEFCERFAADATPRMLRGQE